MYVWSIAVATLVVKTSCPGFNSLSSVCPSSWCLNAIVVWLSLWFIYLPCFHYVDSNVLRPDEKSVITQLVAYYNYFSKMKAEETGGRRLHKVQCVSYCKCICHQYSGNVFRLDSYVYPSSCMMFKCYCGVIITYLPCLHYVDLNVLRPDEKSVITNQTHPTCLLYTSDAADE